MSLPRRFRLAALPTPLVRAERLEAALGAPPLYVKRDDLTGFALAGNKARKLEYTIGDACSRHCDVLVTGGGPRSNHCRAAAAAARAAGLECMVVLYGEEPASPSANLALIRRFGAEVWSTGDADRSSADVAVEEMGAKLEADGRRPYLLPRGGATAVGCVGYAVAFRELAGQLDAQGVEPHLILTATGSCGTQAGLLAGAVAEGRDWRVVGAAVSRPPWECRERVLDLARGVAGLLGVASPDQGRVDVVDARGPGYGTPSDEGARVADLARSTEGLLLDPVFTAKAMAALVRLVREGVEGPVVFLHTGGVMEAIMATVEGRARGTDPGA